LSIPGKCFEVDSLAAAVHAALRHWGREVSYDYVAGLSGAAFSPALGTDQACAACFADSWDGARLEFMGHAVGFTVESSPQGDPAAYEGFLRRVKEAVEEGQVVLCEAWPCWGIVRRWHDDLSQLVLACPGALAQPCMVEHGCRFHVLRPAVPSLTEPEAFREAVRFGASVAAGEYRTDRRTFGGERYGAWLQQTAEPSFCPLCRPDGWRCAERLASRVVGSQLSAVRFLNRAHSLPAVRRNVGQFDAAARAYAAMALNLSPYAVGSGLGEIWKAPAKRERYLSAVAGTADLHRQAARGLARVASTF